MHNQRNRMNALFSMLFLAVLAVPVHASVQQQSHESILQAARDFAINLARNNALDSTSLRVETSGLDPRLRLVRCSQPIEAFESPNTRPYGRTTVGVRCNAEKSWKLYVAVNIAIESQVVALKQGVSRNRLLKASDLTYQTTDLSSLHQGYFKRIQDVVGRQVKNAMRGGTVLTPAHVKVPIAVKKGSMVMIIANTGGISVHMKGKALKSGARGDWIKVENLSSQRKVEGRIVRAGVIEVTL